MEHFDNGIYRYTHSKKNKFLENLPEAMQMTTSTAESVTLLLLLGYVKHKKNDDSKYQLQKYDFTKIPSRKVSFTNESLNVAFSEIINFDENSDPFVNYITNNRKNKFIYERLLFELTAFFEKKDKSSIASFVHLYRALELISYSFPMVFVTKSRNITGSYDQLKKYFNGNKESELKFFERFIDELFKGEDMLLRVSFEIDLSLVDNSTLFFQDIKNIYKLSEKSKIRLDEDHAILHVPFANFIGFFITTRNRFFHMSIGNGQNNFNSIKIDIEQYFKIINPIILNWLSIIIFKISAEGCQ